MEVPVRLEGRRQEKGSAPTFIRGGIHLLFSQNSFCILNVNQSRNSEKDATQVISITMKMGSRGPRDASSINCPEFGNQLNRKTIWMGDCHLPPKTIWTYWNDSDRLHTWPLERCRNNNFRIAQHYIIIHITIPPQASVPCFPVKLYKICVGAGRPSVWTCVELCWSCFASIAHQSLSFTALRVGSRYAPPRLFGIRFAAMARMEVMPGIKDVKES